MPFRNMTPMSLRSRPSVSNSQTEINTVNVNTGATDASAIASDIARELKRQMTPSQQFINARNPAEANAAMAAAEQARQQAER